MLRLFELSFFNIITLSHIPKQVTLDVKLAKAENLPPHVRSELEGREPLGAHVEATVTFVKNGESKVYYIVPITSGDNLSIGGVGVFYRVDIKSLVAVQLLPHIFGSTTRPSIRIGFKGPDTVSSNVIFPID